MGLDARRRLAHGFGPLPEGLFGIALDGERALVTARTPWGFGVYAIDLAGGDRSFLTHHELPGPALAGSSGIAIHGAYALVADWAGLFAVDLRSGQRVLVAR